MVCLRLQMAGKMGASTAPQAWGMPDLNDSATTDPAAAVPEQLSQPQVVDISPEYYGFSGCSCDPGCAARKGLAMHRWPAVLAGCLLAAVVHISTRYYVTREVMATRSKYVMYSTRRAVCAQQQQSPTDKQAICYLLH